MNQGLLNISLLAVIKDAYWRDKPMRSPSWKWGGCDMIFASFETQVHNYSQKFTKR
jgi:hypothetical protein